MKRSFLRTALCATALTMLVSGNAHAIFRAYLSQYGLDTNPCTLQLPCRLLPAALAAVDNGGDIWIVDSANYNVSTVTVTKSVTILAIPGVLGSVVGNGGDAIVINGAGINVTLQNLLFRNLSGIDNDAILVTNASTVTVEGCVVTGFSSGSSRGLNVNAATTLAVNNSSFRGNYAAIYVQGAAKGSIFRTKVTGPGYVGIWAIPSVSTAAIRLAVHETEVSGYSFGYDIQSGSNVTMTITRSVGANGGQAFQHQGAAGSILSVSNSSATGNAFGFVNLGGGVFESFQDNVLSGNTSADTSGVITNRTYR